MENKKPNLIVDLSFAFALEIVSFTELLESQKKYNVANQLFRSGTSIGANVSEAQDSESRKDFIHKLKIAAKEAHETVFWLQLCKHSINYPDTTELINKTNSIIKVISKIIASTIQNK